MYESMIAEALHPGILFYLSGLLSLLAGLAIINLHNTWYADWRVIITVLGWLMTIGNIVRVVLPQIAIAIGSTIYRPRPHDRGRADRRRAGRFPQLQGLRAARLTAMVRSFISPPMTIAQYIRRPFCAWATPIHFAPRISRLARCPAEFVHCFKVLAKSA